MRNDDDEINPFSRQATTEKSTRGTVAPQPVAAKPPPARPRRSNCAVWLIPIVLVIVIIPVLCCGGLAWFGFQLIGEPADAAVAAMEADNQITAKLGKPLERTTSFAVNDYENKNGVGSANVEFEVKGSKGTATVTGEMKLFAEVWSPEDLTITCSDGTEFNLPAEVKP